MKISEIFSALFPKVGRVQGPKAVNIKRVDSQLLKRPDEVKLAVEAKFISTLKAELNKMSNATREEKVTEIKRQVDDGTYKIDADELAQKILGD